MHFSLPTLALALLPIVPAAFASTLLEAQPRAASHQEQRVGIEKRAITDAGAAHYQRARSHTLLARRQRARADITNRTALEGKALVRRKKKRAACQAPMPGTSQEPSGSAGVSSTGAPSAPTPSSLVADSLHAQPTNSAAATASSNFSDPASASQTSTNAAPSSEPSASAPAESASASASASSSAAPAPSAPSTSPNTGSMAPIFPVQGSSWWSTSTLANPALSFADAMTPLTSGKFPATSAAPDGTLGLIANYPGGTYGYSSANGQGFSFYSPASANGVDVSTANEVLFTYSVFFPDGFDFVKGGKLPGIYGGTSLAAAKTCSGGRQDDRADCWSARTMFRTNGMGELYNYFPTSAVQPAGYCSTPPMSVCNPQYGDSIGRGVFNFATGAWTTVGQRLKLNDVGQANGEQELYINGNSVLSLSGLEIAVKDGTHIYGIMAQTFFGGGDSSWANPNTQSAWFKDWSMTVLA